MYYRFQFWISLLCAAARIIPRPVMRWMFRLSEPFGSLPFVLLRYVALTRVTARCGHNVYVGKHVEIRNLERLELGSNVSINRNCYLDCIGGITIGDDVSIAHQCSLVSFEHDWSDPNLPIRKNQMIHRPIVIASDVWIAAGVRILAGAVIGPRTVVAAGAVVTRNLPPHRGVLLTGVPARIKRELQPANATEVRP